MAQGVDTVERGHAHEGDDGGAVGVGDEAGTAAHHALHVVGVDLGHVVVHAEVVAVVDDDGAGVGGHLAPHLAGALGALGAGEEDDVQALEGLGRGGAHVEGLPGDLLIAVARGEDADFGGGEVALAQDLDHLGADGADADQTDFVLLHCETPVCK